jgi:hypothetical protein
MTKHQKFLFDLLLRGFRFRSTIGGWSYDGKRLRVETQDALWHTGELVEIQLKGKRISEWYVCHRSKTKKAAKDQKIIRIKRYSRDTTSFSITEEQ